MSDKCTDPDCRATVTFPNRWHPLKGKSIEVANGRCPDCGAKYVKSRTQGSDDPGVVRLASEPVTN